MWRFVPHSLLRFSNDLYTKAAKQKNVRETFKVSRTFFLSQTQQKIARVYVFEAVSASSLAAIAVKVASSASSIVAIDKAIAVVA